MLTVTTIVLNMSTSFNNNDFITVLKWQVHVQNVPKAAVCTFKDDVAGSVCRYVGASHKATK